MKPPVHAVQRHADGLKFPNSGKPAEAEACFRDAVAACPQWPDAHDHLGLALNARAQYAAALACFERAVQLRLDYADARHRLASTRARDMLNSGREIGRGVRGQVTIHFRGHQALRAEPRFS